MDALKSLNAVSKMASEGVNVDKEHQKYVIHEIKYALLGAALMSIFLIPWSSSLIKSIFPGAKGPLILVYKVILFVCVYYIIQKTTWFQHH